MRRVVVTGMGVVSCLGNSKESVSESLRSSCSGIHFNEILCATQLLVRGLDRDADRSRSTP